MSRKSRALKRERRLERMGANTNRWGGGNTNLDEAKRGGAYNVNNLEKDEDKMVAKVHAGAHAHWQQKFEAYIVVSLAEDVAPKVYIYDDLATWEINRLKDGLDFVEEGCEGKLTFFIDIKNCKWKKVSMNPQMCGFVSTKDYLESRLGIKLDDADRTWYKEHFIMEPGGLPHAHTLTVLNDLVKVYGLGISKVILRPGRSWCEEIQAWFPVLGVNPMGMSDHATSNLEYFRMICPVTKEENPELYAQSVTQVNQFRLQFSNELPQRQMVVCAEGNLSAGAGGHASYKSPRSNPQNWAIAIEFDRIHLCKHHEAAPSYDEQYSKKEEVYSLDIMESIGNHGRPIKEYMYNKSNNVAKEPEKPYTVVDKRVGETNVIIPTDEETKRLTNVPFSETYMH